MTDFSTWFGDSQVTDSEGQPLLVYHGTPWPGFDQFERDVQRSTRHEAGTLGFWFTSDFNVASVFAHKWVDDWYTKPGEVWPHGKPKRFRREKLLTGKVYACYLRIENPAWYGGPDEDGFEAMMDDRDLFARYIDTIKLGVKQQGRHVPSGITKRGHWRRRMIAMDAQETNIDFQLYLESLGHDGIIIQNTNWDAYDAPNNQFVVWAPNQIWIEDVVEPAPNVTEKPENLW